MKLKLFFAAVLVLLVSGLISAQAKQIKAAESTKAPLTSPVTYTLSGQVWYGSRIGDHISPAANVRIDIYDTIQHIGVVIYTDSHGMFSYPEYESVYTVTPSDNFGTTFDPQMVKVKMDQNQYVSFIGYRNGNSLTSVK